MFNIALRKAVAAALAMGVVAIGSISTTSPSTRFPVCRNADATTVQHQVVVIKSKVPDPAPPSEATRPESDDDFLARLFRGDRAGGAMSKPGLTGSPREPDNQQ